MSSRVSTDRAVISVIGPDARSYLQGQISQDLAPLVPGERPRRSLLSPQGKLDAYVRVTASTTRRRSSTSRPASARRRSNGLRRFKLRVKVVIERAADGLHASWTAGSPGAVAHRPARPGPIALGFDWPGLVGIDLIGERDVLPERSRSSATTRARSRRASRPGWPRMGSELDEKTIAAEAGLVGRTVSFTKGCYTGQELVARLDARGNRVPRHLRGLRRTFDTATSPSAGRTDARRQERRPRDERRVLDPTAVLVALGYLRRGGGGAGAE